MTLIISHIALYNRAYAGEGTELSPRPSVSLSIGLSVCPVDELWKNG